MTLGLTVAKYVAGETKFQGSIVARERFSVTVTAPSSSYSGTVTLYANSKTSDTAFKLATVTMKAGKGSATGLMISQVLADGDASRKITAVGANRTDTGSIEIGVWFRGIATTHDFAPPNNCSGSCPSDAVALPAYDLCKTGIEVYSAESGRSTSGKVWDVGPWFDYNHCGSDAYWLKGTVPLATTYKGQPMSAACGGSDKRIINGAIIDISPSMMSALRGSGTINNALWRFA